MNSKPFVRGLNLCQGHRRFLSILRGKHITDYITDIPNYPVIEPLLVPSEKPFIDIPKIISRPINPIEDYYTDFKSPIIYNQDQIEGIRLAASIAAHCIRLAPEILQPGSTTLELNDTIHQEILFKGGYPSILGFKNFPKSISTSVNNVACHGIPDNRPLENGDIVSVDVNVFKDGFHGVCGTSIIVGHSKKDPLVRYLNTVSEELLYRGISACKGNGLLLDIGAEISKFARKRHIKVIPILTGHGIGEYLHCAPDVYHATNNYYGKMEPGMHLTY